MDPQRVLRFLHLPETFAICRLPAEEGIPPWAVSGILFSVTRAPTELSVVCPQVNVPEFVAASRGWRCLMLEGPFELSEVGVLASVAGPLADAGVSIFVVSIFSTDCLLVKQENLKKAVGVLTARGCEVYD